MGTKKVKIAELPDLDFAEHLDSEEAVAEYLSAILADPESTPAVLAAALGDIAKARGMSAVAAQAGLTREALYKALRPESHPRFETIVRVCAALGVKLVAQPLTA